MAQSQYPAPTDTGLTDTELRATAVPVSLASVPSHAVTNAGTFAVQAVLGAGSAVVGHVIADSGSTTAVTGNVTVVQATGSNLHAVLDAGSAAIGKLAANAGVTIGAVEIAAAQTLTSVGTVGTISNVVRVDDNTGSLTVDAPVATPVFVRLSDGASPISTLPVSITTVSAVTTVGTITNVVHVDDNSGSLTVDAPVGTPAFVRLSDGAAAITTLPVSLASVPSHAVTNAGTFAVQADTELPAAVAIADSSSVSTNAPLIQSVPMLWNGTTVDLQRGCVDGVALNSAARTATTNSADIVNYNGRGVLLYMNITVIGASSTLTFMLQGKCPTSGNYVNLHAAASAFNTTGTYGQVFSPGDAQATGATGVINHYSGQLPRTWRLVVTHSNANSCTYSVGYSLLV